MRKQGKKVVVVVPLLNEENNIELFLKSVLPIVNKIKKFSFSFLLVDDGSLDSTWLVLTKLAKKRNDISGIKLSRNFGSHEALMAGIRIASERLKPDYLVLTVVDLQNPPALIPKMTALAEAGARVVWGVRSARKKEKLSAFFSYLYYLLVRRFALPGIPQGGLDYCLIDKKVAQDLIFSGEKNTSLYGQILWLGYKQEMIPYVRKSILGRKSRWTLTRKIKLFIDTFVSFSYAPIWLVTYIGFTIATLGFIYSVFVVIRKFMFDIKIEGWTSLMVVTVILSGINLIMLGIVAEYIWRALDVARRRPMYLIDEELNI